MLSAAEWSGWPGLAPVVPAMIIPWDVAVGMSREALRTPVVRRSFKLGSCDCKLEGKGVRSRMVLIMV